MLSVDLYRKLYLVRRAEERIVEHYGEDDMKTPMHMSMGEEAIAVGVCHALREDDQVFGTYRSHAAFLAKTLDSDSFFAEMYGKATSRQKGKGGSMHLFAPARGFMGTSAIVGTIIPVAIGAAFANKQLRNDRLTTVFFGDGATDEGAFWESLNVACLMELPVLLVCEDNGLAIHTPTSQRHGYTSLPDIVSGFNCGVLASATTDVEEVYQLAGNAIADIREEHRPYFLHLNYYRYLEHVGVGTDFDAGYRSEQEFEEWHARDPVRLQRDRLLAQGTSEEEVSGIEHEIDERVEISVQLAKDGAFAAPEELLRNVLAQ